MSDGTPPSPGSATPGDAQAAARAAGALDLDVLRAWPLPALDHADDKESRGAALVVGGSVQIPGAVLLAAHAALRAGAGKVVIATVQEAAMALAVAMPEARVIGLHATAQGGIHPDAIHELQGCVGNIAALLVGPGMNSDPASVAAAAAVLQLFDGVPTVLDAGAMDAVLPHAGRGQAVLLTPHAGEMAHLSGAAKAAVVADPAAAARAAAAQWQAVVALKGARTCIAHPDGRLWLHQAGHAGLGTAGSGDVLAGLMVGFVARGASLEQAAAWAVVLHAAAGARLAARGGALGFLARELSPEVPALLDPLLHPPSPAPSPAQPVQHQG